MCEQIGKLLGGGIFQMQASADARAERNQSGQAEQFEQLSIAAQNDRQDGVRIKVRTLQQA